MSDRDNEKKRFAVTGSPVLHSKSPWMFDAVFKQQALPASYTRLAASSAGEAISLFKHLDLHGMNVTAPFKGDIIRFLDTADIPAVRIGGVNTVVRENHGLKGYNTDYTGVVESFKKRGIPLKGRRCIVLGAGGAGRAALYGLTREGADVIAVNRTYLKAVNAARDFGCASERIERLEELLQSADILVCTLSPGIDIIPAAWLPRRLVVLDANYKKSRLCENAQKNGCTIIKGEEWLLNQALPAYRHFMGVEPDNGAAKAMKEALLSPPREKPKTIALTGFMGCGKTAVGRSLARRMGLPFKDIDALIEAREGRTIPEIFSANGEDYFRRIEKAVLKRELESSSGVVYGCGGGAVLDEENKGLLKTNALVVWLYSSIPVTLRRLEPGTRPLLEVADPEARARELLDQRLDHYARSADLVVSSEAGIDEIAEKIHAEIDKAFS